MMENFLMNAKVNILKLWTGGQSEILLKKEVGYKSYAVIVFCIHFLEKKKKNTKGESRKRNSVKSRFLDVWSSKLEHFWKGRKSN